MFVIFCTLGIGWLVGIEVGWLVVWLFGWSVVWLVVWLVHLIIKESVVSASSGYFELYSAVEKKISASFH